MKRFLVILLFALISVSAIAQEPIKFLGIPVDGTKKEMISKLKEKGYEYEEKHDFLSGEFNGTNVLISVTTVNNRVWRIAVIDADGTDETNIKIRFNNLFEQLSNKGKYKKVNGEQ